jgi:hypothetical protein
MRTTRITRGCLRRCQGWPSGRQYKGFAPSAEGADELAQDLQGGLGLASLVATELRDVDAGGIGEGLLGEALLLAQCDKAILESHLCHTG